MTYDTNFDGQKLMFHPVEVAEWLRNGRTRGPVYTEMELCASCNCRCTFCGVDYLVNKSDNRIAAEDARCIIDGLHELGNRSIMFSGHGEPLLNPDAREIITYASSLMSTSLTTNGLALTESNLALIDGLEWIRFSINGGTPESYAQVQGVDAVMFERALEHIAAAASRKREKGLKVIVGTQLVLVPENAGSAIALAVRVKDLGVDYFSVKPYSQHPLSSQRPAPDYSRYADLEQQLSALQSDRFRVIYRAGSMQKVGREKTYGECFGTHFISFIDAGGDVWECNVFVGDSRFCCGNALRENLREIWSGKRRAEVLDFIAHDLHLAECRDVCRMDECNRYLWRLKHPLAHDDFI